MTESRFEEIVSQYLDRECSRSRVRQLRRILRRNPELRKRFDEACRFYYAEKVAFNPSARKQIAQEIASLRAEVLRRPGLKPLPRNGKDRYRVGSFPPSAIAAMAAAVVAMVALGQGFLSTGSEQQGFRALKPFFGNENGPVQVRMEPRVSQSENRLHNTLNPVAGSLSVRLHLSGLSETTDYSLDETAESPDWESLFATAAEAEPRKRLVLVVPQKAIPDADLRAEPKDSISFTPISAQWGGYSSLRSTTILSLTDRGAY